MIYDAVFIYMNVLNGNITGAEYQLDSAYIRSYLKKNDINTMQYVHKNPSSLRNLIGEISQIKSKCLVFYINEYNYFVSKTIINLLKLADSKVQICAIGPVVKFISEELLNDISIDVCILDRDAFALKDIFTNNTSIENIHGIVYKKYGTIIRTGILDDNFSLDDLGLIYSDGLIPPEEIQNVGLISSMGCYGSCSFCSYNNKSNRFRQHEIENVIYELKYINQYIKGNDVKVCFFDDCFSVSNERTYQLCKRIVAEKINLRFWCCTRSDLLSEELIDVMAEANFRDIVIGLETASSRVMDQLGKVKNTDNSENYIENLKKMYNYAKKQKINPIISVNFGLPNERFEDALQTINFIKDNSLKDNTSICFMTSFPESRIFAHSEYYNVTQGPSPTGLPYRTYYTNYNMRVLYDNMVGDGIINSSNSLYQQIDKEIVLIRLQSFFTGISLNRYIEKPMELIKINGYCKPEMEFIHNNGDLNGKVIFIRNSLKILDKYMFCEDRKNLRLGIEEYDKNAAVASELNRFLPRQVYVNNFNGVQRVIVDNIYTSKPLELHIKKADSLERLGEIGEKAKRVFLDNYITLEEVRGGLFENSCCFSGVCSLSRLFRVSIEDNTILGCFNRGEVGSAFDT
ncbi:MAG: radical SAM protein, partial [Clostridium sp.]|nr:radical SAM protein [Clostridium sp.]